MYSKIELLALVKQHNKIEDNPKIKNVDKMKKDDILAVCKKYGILPVADECTCDIKVDLRNIKKADLLQDVEMHFLKQNKQVPADVLHMKKKMLIDYMELNGIQHYTQEILNKEVKEYQRRNILKNKIIMHIMKYDDIDILSIPDDIDGLEEFVQKLPGDDLQLLPQYSLLLKTLYDAYDVFCKNTKTENDADKIKSFPKILNKLQNILE
jgi:hypothetical protein